MTTPRNGIDWGWVSRELGALGVSPPVNDTVTNALAKIGEDRERFDLTDDDVRQVLGLVHKLALGHSVAPPPAEEKWGPVVPGAYRIRDTVRVKSDAYDGNHGILHNGKRGRVVAARDGRVLVVYDDAVSADIMHRHPPEKLQRLVT